LKTDTLTQGGKVARKSFLIQLMVGFSEVFMGLFTVSVALIADGIQSFADAGVSLIVWIGLRISRRKPDGKFRFGYHRVETFSSLVAALFMATLGGVVLYESTLELFNPTRVADTEIALLVASAAALVSSILLIYKTQAAKKYGSLALKTDAFNSIKDVLTSITAFIGIAAGTYLNLPQMDAIAGIIIAIFVFTMVYTIMKEASLVLLDACQCPEVLTEIEKIATSIHYVKAVRNIRMRKSGSYLVGDMQVALDENMTVKQACEIASAIEEQTKREFDEVLELKVRIEPHKKPQIP
jgi:cation diffusion facilitator family transporter